MQIKVSEATALQLAYLAAVCEGLPLLHDPMAFVKEAPGSPEAGWWVWQENPTRHPIAAAEAKRLCLPFTSVKG